jgi:UDP-N-acetyl-D-galactosamine dehydrogenase
MNTKKQLAIIGLGYVGLPLAIEFAKKYKIIGFDMNVERVAELNQLQDLHIQPIYSFRSLMPSSGLC